MTSPYTTAMPRSTCINPDRDIRMQNPLNHIAGRIIHALKENDHARRLALAAGKLALALSQIDLARTPILQARASAVADIALVEAFPQLPFSGKRAELITVLEAEVKKIDDVLASVDAVEKVQPKPEPEVSRKSKEGKVPADWPDFLKELLERAKEDGIDVRVRDVLAGTTHSFPSKN